MNTIIKILIALLVFSVIVVIHELGHFLLAKKNKIGVIEFSVGMGPRLFSFTKGETKYSLKLLPIGGSCMMVGEERDVESEDSFQKKSVWARMSVILAGPFFNFILAFVLAVICVAYSGWDFADIGKVDENMPAYEYGLKDGDRVLSVNDHSIMCERDLMMYMNYGDVFSVEEEKENEKIYKPVTFKILRDGKEQSIDVTPKSVYYFSGVDFDENDYRIIKKIKDDNGSFAKAGIKAGDKLVKLNGKELNSSDDFIKEYNGGIILDSNVELSYERDGEVKDVKLSLTKEESRPKFGFSYKGEKEKVSPLGVLGYAFKETGFCIKNVVDSLGLMIKGKVSKDDISGVVGIVDFIGDSYEQSKSGGFLFATMNLLEIALLLSANLGVMNLIPFPALDGGRFALLLVEAITKKKVKEEIEGMINLVGFAILMLFMIFITWNDISKIIH